jgi:hypothetical protein
MIAMGGTVADEVIGFIQRFLPQVARAVGILGDHQHIVLGNRNWSPSCRPGKGPCWASMARA